MSATDNLGAHLLGRKPSLPDFRDFKLADYLTVDAELDAALAAFLKKHYSQAAQDLAKLVVARIEGTTPAPPPPTPAPTGAVVWPNTNAVLDQGQTPHCVGFGAAQWGNTQPVDDHFVNADGDDLYYACKVVDGEPGAEDGSTARSAAKVLQTRGRLKTYAFAANIAEVKAFVRTKGPVMFGTDWTNDMFNPDASGYVKPTGGVAGGHFYVCVGDLPDEDALEFLNSWGAFWGLNGRFKLKTADAARLMAQQGEVLAAVELP